MDMLLVLDFGGAQGQFTARRIRGENFYSEILPYTATAQEIGERNPKGLLLVGDAGDAWAEGAPDCAEEIYEMGLPILGIGYGARIAARHFGAKSEGIALQDRPAHVEFAESAPFRGIGECDRFFQRCDGLTLPEGFESAVLQGEAGAAYVCADKKTVRHAVFSGFARPGGPENSGQFCAALRMRAGLVGRLLY